MVDAVGVADLVIKQTRQDERDGRRPGAADVGEDAVEAGDVEGRDVAQHQDGAGDEGEAELRHGDNGRAVTVDHGGGGTGRGKKRLAA